MDESTLQYSALRYSVESVATKHPSEVAYLPTLVLYHSTRTTFVIYRGSFFYLKTSKTQRLTYTAVLSALSVVANIFSVQILGTTNYLSFAYIPAYIAGIYLGVWAGGMVGLVGDVLGCLIMPQGAWNIIITLSSMLLGVIPALVYKYAPKSFNNIVKLILSLVLTALICTSGLGTLGLYLMYGNGKGYWIYLVGRLPFQLAMVVVNGILLQIIQSSKLLPRLLHQQSNTPPDAPQ